MVQPADPDMMAWLDDVKIRPTSSLATIRLGELPSEEEVLRWLKALVADHLGPLIAREAQLRTNFDDADRAEAGARALVIEDAASSRLFLRYQSEARTSFHRAYSELVKALARDTAEAAELAEAVGEEAGEEVEKVEPPNEPNCGARPIKEASSGGSNPPARGSAGSDRRGSSVLVWSPTAARGVEGAERAPIGPSDACSA
jgi:hypothetical protein